MLKSRTFVATPAYRGEVVMQYAHCLVRDVITCLASGHYVEAPFIINDTLVHNARNLALKAFVDSGADHLVMIDSDMGWEAGALQRLIEAGGDIVAGLYRTKQDEENYPFNTLPGVGMGAPVAPIASAPTGFMKITGGCARSMLESHARPFDFSDAPDGGQFGEDITFCNRARELGFGVVGIADIHFEHCGPSKWSGRAWDFLSQRRAA